MNLTIKKFTREYKTELLLFLFAVFSGFFLWFIIYYFLGFSSGTYYDSRGDLHFLISDASGYYRVAENFLKNDVMSISEKAPFLPISFRTPGYPFFESVILFFSNNINNISFVQIVLHGFSVVLVYLIGKNFFNRKIALLSAIFYSIEPTALFFSLVTMSESLFVFLLLVIVYLIVVYSENQTNKPYYTFLFSGLMLGFLILVKPIAQFFIFLLIFYVIFSNIKDINKILFKKILLLILMTLIVVSPWIYRNYKIFGNAGLSSAKSSNFVLYNIPTHYALVNSISYKEARKIFEEMRSVPDGRFEYVKSMYTSKRDNEIIINYLKNNFFSYSVVHVLKGAPFFLSDGLRLVTRKLKIGSSNPPNVGTHILNNNWTGLFSEISRMSSLDIFSFILGTIFWIIFSLLFFIGIIFSLFVKNAKIKKGLILSILIVFYFFILTGPVANSRYRLPAQPYIFFVGFYVYYEILDWFKGLKNKINN